MAQQEISEDDLLRSTLAAAAPGTMLREGLERILRGRTGALIVLGSDKVVDSIASGGFPLEVEFSPTRLRELAKMDGAIVCDREASRILRAGTQLLPDPSIETTESGTRHRTAERVAKQTGYPVIAVSQSMRIIALYVGNRRHVLEDSSAIMSRANQALATLERYKLRLDEVTGTLSALEIEDLVTVRDVAAVIQRLEMVRRISDEISGYVIELGSDGRLLTLQLEELIGGVGPDRELVIRDYLSPAATVGDFSAMLADLGAAVVDRAARPQCGRPADGLQRGRRRARRSGQPARLPAAVEGAAPARRHRRAAGRALRQPAEAAGRRPGGPAGRRGCRRGPRPRRPRGPEPPGRVQHPRALRLTRRPSGAGQPRYIPIGVGAPSPTETLSVAACRHSNRFVRGVAAATTTAGGARGGEGEVAEQLVEPVLDWYDAHARDLPWRQPDRTPWGVLVSEVMLQQTPVRRVEPVWQRWMDRWPTPTDLAAATSGDAVRAWDRLGYPRRALRLHAAATQIRDRHAGQVPSEYDELRALDGVGDYTAAAVATFAFGRGTPSSTPTCAGCWPARSRATRSPRPP